MNFVRHFWLCNHCRIVKKLSAPLQKSEDLCSRQEEVPHQQLPSERRALHAWSAPRPSAPQRHKSFQNRMSQTARAPCAMWNDMSAMTAPSAPQRRAATLVALRLAASASAARLVSIRMPTASCPRDRGTALPHDTWFTGERHPSKSHSAPCS